MNFEERQEHFEYRTPKDLVVHGEPFSPEKWNAILLKIAGRCPAGDPRLRIVWGGTAKKRGYFQGPEQSIECDVIKYPAPVPNIRRIKGYNYFNDEGNVNFVVRPDHIPAGKIGMPVIESYQLGQLRWMLERKFTPEELVAMEMYPDPRTEAGRMYGVRGGRRYVAPMGKKGEYVPLYPLQTPDGRYWEPDEGWFDHLDKTQKQIEATTEGARMVLLNEAMDDLELRERKAAERQADEEDTLFEETLIEVEKMPRGVKMVDQHIQTTRA